MEDVRSEMVRLIPRLRRHARALIGNAADADDLVQDCLERAVSRLHLWQPGTNLRAWLFTIMRNLHVNSHHRRRAAPPTVPLVEDGPDPAGPDPHAGPLAMRDLARALDALSDEQRQVLLLVGLEGLRYEEAARVLDLPIGTVMSRLSRGRETLRRLMGEDQPTRMIRRVK